MKQQHAEPKVVPFTPPPGADAVVALLEHLLARAREGEFATMFCVAICPDGNWVTVERGAKKDVLRTLGILESLKADILASTETGKPSGL